MIVSRAQSQPESMGGSQESLMNYQHILTISAQNLPNQKKLTKCP